MFETGWTHAALAVKFNVSIEAVKHCLNAEQRRDIARARYHLKYKRTQAEKRNREQAAQLLEQAMEYITDA